MQVITIMLLQNIIGNYLGGAIIQLEISRDYANNNAGDYDIHYLILLLYNVRGAPTFKS